LRGERTASRTDGVYVGKQIREIVRFMIEQGVSWKLAADSVGLKRSRAFGALHKPHVIAYRRETRKQFIELLSTRVPLKLSSLMDSENAAAAVRAALALEELNNESRAEPRLSNIHRRHCDYVRRRCTAIAARGGYAGNGAGAGRGMSLSPYEGFGIDSAALPHSRAMSRSCWRVTTNMASP
jgi:hypothetical protein